MIIQPSNITVDEVTYVITISPRDFEGDDSYMVILENDENPWLFYFVRQGFELKFNTNMDEKLAMPISETHKKNIVSAIEQFIKKYRTPWCV